MADQVKLAEAFAELHIKGDPIILFNVWDAGTAKAAQDIGAKAIATGSWAVAAAHGFDDGEKIPLDLACANLERIVAAVDLPVTFDVEGGYASDPEQVANIARAIKAGAVGVNFEDQIVNSSGLFSIDEQAARIAAIRAAADRLSVPIFINARTDVFLPLDPATHTESHLEEAITRAAAYAEAGASGFFAPGLIDPDLIGRLCKGSPLPVNIMVWPGVPSSKQLADLRVARVSYGGGSYAAAMQAFKETGIKALEWNKPADKAANN